MTAQGVFLKDYNNICAVIEDVPGALFEFDGAVLLDTARLAPALVRLYRELTSLGYSKGWL